jgi:hypothetical protein
MIAADLERPESARRARVTVSVFEYVNFSTMKAPMLSPNDYIDQALRE